MGVAGGRENEGEGREVPFVLEASEWGRDEIGDVGAE